MTAIIDYDPSSGYIEPPLSLRSGGEQSKPLWVDFADLRVSTLNVFMEDEDFDIGLHIEMFVMQGEMRRSQKK